MEQQLREDEALTRALAQYDREVGRSRARQRQPEPRRATAPVRAARGDRSPLTGFLAIVIVVVALIVGYDRWRTGKVDPSLSVPLSDHAAMPRVTSLQRPPAGFEEAPERLLPAVSAAGLEGAYLFIDTHRDMPVTWSPCRPIRVVVDTARAPEDFVDWVSHVLAEASGLSGLTFVLDGTTTERVSFEREAYQPDRNGGRWAPVIIGFADETEIPARDRSPGSEARPGSRWAARSDGSPQSSRSTRRCSTTPARAVNLPTSRCCGTRSVP